MKIVYVSGVKFGLELLREILQNNFDIIAVFSYDETKKYVYSDYANFDDICDKNGIKNIKVNNINDEENIELLRSMTPDLILVMGWSQLLKKEILETSIFGVIGSHPTELPKYRGRAPIPWSIIKELKESALTFFYIEEGVDDGDILDQQKFNINDNDDASILYDKITTIGKSMIIKNLNKLQNGSSKRIKQDPSKFLEYWPKRTIEDGLIDWSKSAKEISTLIRASTHPYPGAFTYYNNKKLKVFKATYLDNKTSNPGKILSITHDEVHVGTGNGIVSLRLVQYGDDPETNASFVVSNLDVGKTLGYQIA